MASRTTPAPDPKVSSSTNADSFEAALARLEQIVQRLERGELPLEESLKSYEEGVALVRAAQGKLDVMDARLEQLLGDGRTAALKLDDDGGAR